ncbi:pyrroline-5-carboxylate reductase [Sphingomonas jejuensis]|uniref:Pyrroline-5-carboxylate reductase n=1 Tax=Sphingomonas jejuensis TaxID=904715 RepID=A0ABX0XHJ2_9SPHN|nr:pyrroline-5-carboxylate reductase [Sphingomonas jejuensis]NJC32801.1 pyrroline-5-carboxylate reductase [Sphingomonas jejuensis]
MFSDYPETMLLFGCGAMAGAMLSRWLESGLSPDRVTVVRPSGAAVAPGVRVERQLPSGLTADLVLVGVKPAMLGTVADDISATMAPGGQLLSILAGVTHASLRERFPAVRSIVRAMPNLPVALGAGVVALHAPDAGPDECASLTALHKPLGLVEWIEDEADYDAVTALAGSGPAFLYRFIDALAKGGAATGLDPAQAARLALVTVEGSARLATMADASPAALADRVASKGGSTRAGLDRLDADGALDRLVAETLAAATARNRDMGRENG